MKAIESYSLSTPDRLEVCPICQSRSYRLFNKHSYWIRGCLACRHRFAELQPSPNHTANVYGDDYFHGGGAGYPDYLSEAEILRRHGRRYARLLAKYTQPGTLLDVGSAAGFILQGFCERGWQGEGLEPNAQMATYARRQLGLTVRVGSLEELPLKPIATYDVISMVQVVGHFFDLAKAFEVAQRYTNPGGFWLIESWNRNSFTAQILGSHWHEYSPPSVLHWFSPQGLNQIADQHGFREVARGRPAKWLSGAHAKSLLRYKLRGDSRSSDRTPWAERWLELIPDHWAIPYPAEDLFWILFQQSGR